jgi:glyoxylase-like metal-dependent hydrolase (beta-lactamase superfamily II)
VAIDRGGHRAGDVVIGIGAKLLVVLLQVVPPTGRLVSIAPHAWAWISADDHSANGALFVGERAAAVVDPGLTPAHARALFAAARGVTRLPVRTVILTHWHPDHALGITCFGSRSFEVVAHATAARAIAERGAAIAKAIAAQTGDAGLATCRVAPPDHPIAAITRLDLGGRTIAISPVGPAHTDGDLVVFEPTENVLVTGDVFMHRASPDMGEAHPAHWMRVLDSLVASGPRAVVAGHFGPSTPADLARFRDYLAALDRRVGELIAARVPPDSVPARVQLPEFADFAQFPAFHATIKDNAIAFVTARTRKE